MHVIFHSELTSNLLLSVSGSAPQGITFPLLHMKQFDSISGFDILTLAHPYPDGEIHAQRKRTFCCTVLASKSGFHLVIVIFPEKSK